MSKRRYDSVDIDNEIKVDNRKSLDGIFGRKSQRYLAHEFWSERGKAKITERRARDIGGLQRQGFLSCRTFLA
jgi:hypothetical protein